jgi:hypothetical protein
MRKFSAQSQAEGAANQAGSEYSHALEGNFVGGGRHGGSLIQKFGFGERGLLTGAADFEQAALITTAVASDGWKKAARVIFSDGSNVSRFRWAENFDLRHVLEFFDLAEQGVFGAIGFYGHLNVEKVAVLGGVCS